MPTMTIQSRRSSAAPATQRFGLMRRFVETGDERCPLAGIWLRLPELDAELEFALDDEPSLTTPAMEALLLWRAYSFLHHISLLPYRLN
jgi:hypothetical protein